MTIQVTMTRPLITSENIPSLDSLLTLLGTETMEGRDNQARYGQDVLTRALFKALVERRVTLASISTRISVDDDGDQFQTLLALSELVSQEVRAPAVPTRTRS